MGLVLAFFGSIVTTGVYVWFVWRLDRHEKEPARMLAAAFLWGMTPAIVLSIVLELSLEAPLAGFDGMAATLLSDAGFAPVVEESAKGLALLAFLVFAYHELDHVLDGIVYGAMVGLGFAMSENVLYVVAGVEESGLSAGVAILFLRTVVFGANHAFFSALVGAGVGAARVSHGAAAKLLFLFAGWLLAVSFHSLHNVSAAFAEATDLASLGVSFIAQWGGVAALIAVVVLLWRRERRLIATELASEVASGMLTQQELAALTSGQVRRQLFRQTLQDDGWTAYRRLKRVLPLLTELAFAKRRMRRAGEAQSAGAAVASLRERIANERLPASKLP